MTGLDKIVKRIEDEANAEAAVLLEKANADAKAAVEHAVAQARSQADKTLESAHAQADDIEKNAQSAALLAKRQALLAKKQQLIGGVIADARRALLSLPDADYFSLIERLVDANVLAQPGRICFSQTDLDRLPTGYALKLGVLATAKGGALTLDKEARDIDGGFILIYNDERAGGDIEINCSFEALFYAAQETLQDKVSAILFA